MLDFFHKNIHLVVNIDLYLVSIFGYLLLIYSQSKIVCFLYLLPVVYFCHQNLNFLNTIFLFFIEIIFKVHLLPFESFYLTFEKIIDLSLDGPFLVRAPLASNSIPYLSGQLIKKCRVINHNPLSYFAQFILQI